ncbi:hypothetical protein [Streptacidiphilus sp. EB129]|uniref:hypothetical protein n=1 Tax=Streptacidiphilus sp. EB129 TaxID=3156262 RepID=UPI0035153F9A
MNSPNESRDRKLALIEGTLQEEFPAADIPAALGDAFAARTGFDPRAETDAAYHYFRIRPLRLQAWREANELSGRTLMRNGRWQ